ncbi:MAG: redoxin family protein [Phycisphaeraceae bacterium]|nr:redoxin family protein [Phycisphaeraceae bacterium]
MSNRGWKYLASAAAAGMATVALAAGAWGLDQPDSPRAVSRAPEGAKIGEKVEVNEIILKDTEGEEHNIQAYLDEGKTVVLEWFNPDCPYVKKHHVLNHSMAEAYEWTQQHEDIVWLAVNSGAPGKQGAGLERNVRAKEEYKIEYPILLDEEGTLGHYFNAKTTPDMRVITKDGVLVYAGAIDNNDDSREVGDVIYVTEALKSVLAGETVAVAEARPYGCSVKYASPTRSNRPGR